ncbi:MAG: hypothetical protein AAB092_03195 [Chloroflexota bacterium]
MSRKTALGAVVAAACLLFVACGGGDDNDSTATVSPAPNPNLDAGATQQLRDLAGKWGAASTKVTYTLASTLGSITTDTQVIVYRKSPDRRIDHISANGTVPVIIRSDAGYSCWDKTASCTLLSVGEAEAASEFPFVNDLADSAGLDAIIAEATALESAPARKVIGRETNCLKAGGDLGGFPGEATWCFTEDGLLLAMSYTGSVQTLEMTATAIEGAKDADFDPPYPVAAIPLLPSP